MEFPRQYSILIDNMSAIALAAGPATHYQRTKHIGAKYHFQRDLLLQGMVRYQHQATTVQIADIMTKDLHKTLHKKHREVIFGNSAIQIVSHRLPESQKVYLRRHNEESERKTKEVRLSQALSVTQQERHGNLQLVKSLLALIEPNWQLK